MQRIDILLSLTDNTQRILVPIELKSVHADRNNVNQLQRYIDWLRQYYIPNRPSDIQPVLIAKKDTNIAADLIQSFHNFNQFNNTDCRRLKFVEFDIVNDSIIFEEVDYIEE